MSEYATVIRYVVASYGKGARGHNGGRYRKHWLLWSDGTVERTSARSKYQPPFDDEDVPPAIQAAAWERGLTLTGFRSR